MVDGILDLAPALLAVTAEPASMPASAPSVFFSLFPPASVALTVLAVSIVAVSGLAIGSIRLRGFALGIPGVMFTGLIVGRLMGMSTLSRPVVEFIRDFGLILFVYAVGVQVGPGFVASLRKQGLRLNALAATIVLLGAILSVGMGLIIPSLGISGAAGLFAGATTNAPAFGSAGEALKTVHGTDAIAIIATSTAPAFAITYPFGLFGVILAMVLLRAIFRVNPQREADEIERQQRGDRVTPATMNIDLVNPNMEGLTVKGLEELHGTGVVISRVLHGVVVSVARPDLMLHTRDVIFAVGEPKALEALRLIAGQQISADLRILGSHITSRQILVTHPQVLGKTLNELSFADRLGVTITRFIRGELQFTAVSDIRLQFGDRVLAVGEDEALDEAAKTLGNSMRELNLPRLLPIFVGLALGVTLGMLPLRVPGLPVPLKLGLAAGPMVVAILLARLGRVRSLIWYMPFSAAALLRELGIVLFLIGVGLLAGEGFFATLWSTTGLYLLGLGAIVTFVPLIAVGLFARIFLKSNFLQLCGLLAGSLTSPSLAFVHTITDSEAPAVAFATVYPLTMILRVLVAQLIVLLFTGS